MYAVVTTAGSDRTTCDVDRIVGMQAIICTIDRKGTAADGHHTASFQSFVAFIRH